MRAVRIFGLIWLLPNALWLGWWIGDRIVP